MRKIEINSLDLKLTVKILKEQDPCIYVQCSLQFIYKI